MKRILVLHTGGTIAMEEVTYTAGAQVVHMIEAIEPNVYPFVMIYDFKQRHDFWAMSV